jgi:hypothetical protein
MSRLVTRLSSRLTSAERDELKLRLSLRAAACLDQTFSVSEDPDTAARFSRALAGVLATQPYERRVPRYGIAGRSHDLFSADELARLRSEAADLRGRAILNFGQQALVHAEELPSSMASALASARKVVSFVESVAGPCRPTHVATYVYYDAPGMRSDPHVDNTFSAVTLMLLLRHDHRRASTTVSYWPGSPRLAITMAPGEAMVFFGSAVLHARTPVAEGESVSSLLLSFQPR